MDILLALILISSPLNVDLITTIEICNFETRGEVGKKKDEAIGRDDEIGFCQIKLTTAQAFLGFKGGKEELKKREVNFKLALKFVHLIKKGLKRKCGHASFRTIAFGYRHGHLGLRCKPKVNKYEDQIALNIKATITKLEKDSRKLLLIAHINANAKGN